MTKKSDTTDAGPVRVAKDARPSPLSAVSGLMEERRRFESWLAGLEARRDATPARVFARVHADYTTRLEAVVAKLTMHTEGLRAELGNLTSQLAAAHEDQQHARDERAEAELRAHVGELSAEEWEATARAADERIDSLASRHADLETELQRTRELLVDAERPATPHLSSAAIADRAGTDASVEASISASVAAASANPTPSSLPAVADSAEAAMHVPGGAAKAPGRETSTGASAPVEPSANGGMPAEITPEVIAAEAKVLEGGAGIANAPPRRAGSSTFDELAFLNSVVDTPGGATASPERAAPAPAPVARRDAYEARPKDSARDGGIENRDATADTSILNKPGNKGTPLAANISGNNPIVLRDKAENAKTLKCADCGAMNYPTEWYCERCGAELASL